VGGAKRPGVRDWLAAARHPGRRDGVIAVALLMLPWVLAWVLAPRHHLDATAVTILVAVTIGLSTLWLTWAGIRNASRAGPTDGEAAPANITAGPGSAVAGAGGAAGGQDAVVAGPGGTAIGQGAVVATYGGTAIGQVVQPGRPEAAGLPISLPPRPAALAGRVELLAEMDRLLATGAAPRTVVLSGMGGVGKTALAAEYAHRHLADVSVAWQVPAEDPAVMAADVAELAAQLGGRDLVDPRAPVASVHAVLAAWPSDWLLIFDNALDEGSVRRLLPPAGRGRVIVTSQSQHWPGAEVLDVPVLDAPVAARFLVSRAGDPDEAAAGELAGELGGLPLALEQAAGYIHATGTTLVKYLSMFQDRRDDLLARGQAVGHPADVAATLGLALSRLEEQAPAAVGLARLLACLAPEPVPLDLLLADAQVAGKRTPGVAAAVGPLLGDPDQPRQQVIHDERHARSLPPSAPCRAGTGASE
jgi:hypothetical protein